MLNVFVDENCFARNRLSRSRGPDEFENNYNRAVPTVGQSSALESGGPQFRLV
jgi:hypothetical protein